MTRFLVGLGGRSCSNSMALYTYIYIYMHIYICMPIYLALIWVLTFMHPFVLAGVT